MAPIFFALAQLIPSIVKYATASGTVTEKITDAAADIARTISGEPSTVDAINKIAKDPQMLAEFQLKVTEQQILWDKLYFDDIASARARDVELNKAGNRNYRADVMTLLAVGVIVMLFFAVWSDDNINEFVKGVVTLCLGRFLGYLDTIYQFEFGTTRASNKKDDTINSLTKG